MISVIICSAYADRLEKVKQSIAATIGVPYELITTDNAVEKIGIRRAYNRSARAAKYDILCFMHDDLELLTMDWGKRVLQHFEDPSLAMTGLAGSRYKSKTLSGWSSCVPNCDCCCIRQLKPDGQTEQVCASAGHRRECNSRKSAGRRVDVHAQVRLGRKPL